MPDIPIIIFPTIVILISAIGSVLLFSRIKKDNLLSPVRFFFKNYAFGFAIFSLITLPIFFINLRLFTISNNFLLILYAVSFFALLFTYLLFYRGAALLFTKDKFLTTIFPLIFLPLFAIVTVVSLFIYKIDIFIIYTAVIWGFIIPLTSYLGSLFLYFFIKGSPFDTMKRRSHALILSLGWFLVLMLEIFLWFDVATYPQEFWILKVSSSKGYLLGRALANLMILVGALLYGRALERSKMNEEKQIHQEQKTPQT